ncbi:hypothetical protein RRF57_009924 [Xylaria bambusicola]|uniref:Uncharacterized protein n=1 Tax=Xylaria bambusicola TaxID=326684 RepID=A0AAN7UKF8_9PEZI
MNRQINTYGDVGPCLDLLDAFTHVLELPGRFLKNGGHALPQARIVSFRAQKAYVGPQLRDVALQME